MSKLNKPTNWTIESVQWQQAEQPLREIRTQVFIVEQQVPIYLEWDGLDATAQHLLAKNQAQQIIGCARILAEGSIGRMAVLKQWRGLGVGSALLNAAMIAIQSQGCKHARLSAQTHAIPFYARFGFKVVSTPYLDADILHQDMQLIFD